MRFFALRPQAGRGSVTFKCLVYASAELRIRLHRAQSQKRIPQETRFAPFGYRYRQPDGRKNRRPKSPGRKRYSA